MKVDGGVGLRAYMRKFLIRLDLAGSDEGVSMTFWLSHPFQFAK